MLAVFAEPALRKYGGAGSGMGGQRPWPITPILWGTSLPQASAHRRLPDGWASAEPRCGDPLGGERVVLLSAQ
jgi:hypothetical protein